MDVREGVERGRKVKTGEKSGRECIEVISPVPFPDIQFVTDSPFRLCHKRQPSKERHTTD
jgi:hypothetical protein